MAGIKSRGELNAEIEDLKRQRFDITSKAAERIVMLRQENDRLRSALKPFVFGDPAIEKILFGDMDGNRTGTITIKLRHIRKARDVLEPR